MREVFENIPEEFVAKTATYDQKVPITSVIGDINKFGAVVITKDKQYYGIIDHRTLVRRGSLRVDNKFASGKFAHKVPVIASTSSIADAINLFYHSSSKTLPYAEGSAITGIIKRDEVLKAILSLHLLSKIKVSSIMSTPLVGIDYNVGIRTAIKLMSENRVSRLAVFLNGKLYGLLTYGNIARTTVKTKGRKPEIVYKDVNEGNVGDICEKGLMTIDHGEKIDGAIRQLVNNKISSLVVMRRNKPVGIISVRDILESVIKGWQSKEDNIILTGLGKGDEQYREDVVNSISKTLAKINRFGKFDVDYASINVKRVKTKGYELKARIGLGKRGVVHVAVSGYLLDKTLKLLESRLYKLIEEEKDITVTSRKEAGATYEDEEV